MVLARALPILLLVACITPALAQEIPRNDGWVTDLGGFLTPEQERSLETLMESYKSGSTNEIALLTVSDLGGQSLEGYALSVARGWGIGTKQTHNGALLLVARAERKIRIEVGRGLEGNLTDSISGRIIRNVIAPEFKKGRLYEGLRGGIEAMHAAAGGDYGKIPKGRGSGAGGAGVLGLIPMLFWVLIGLAFMRRMRRSGVGGGGLLTLLMLGSLGAGRHRSGGFHGGSGGGFGGFGGGGGFSGGGASGGW